jgi:hypothetical protein
VEKTFQMLITWNRIVNMDKRAELLRIQVVFYKTDCGIKTFRLEITDKISFLRGSSVYVFIIGNASLDIICLQIC